MGSALIRQCLRPCILVVGTAVSMLVLFLATILLEPIVPIGWILGTALGALMFLGPFVIVPLHFRWQAPKESNVALAFATGLLSWGLGWVLIATLGFAFYIHQGGSI